MTLPCVADQPAEAVEPYEALAEVYDRWTSGNDYAGWVRFIVDQWSHGDRRVERVLDVCCGTGTAGDLLARKGLQVVGVDCSSAMLRQAAEKLVGRAHLVGARLPELPFAESFDAAICLFDSLNYLDNDAELGATFRQLAEALRPRGWLIFDINTLRKLEQIFGNTKYGEDRGDFAYVWENAFDPTAKACTFHISIFLRRGAGFLRVRERHRQRAFDPGIIRGLAEAAGFEDVQSFDDFTSRLATDQTLRSTWVMRRRASA